MRERLEHYFEFSRLQTNWRTEILAGLTTFVTMAYIIFVNPSLLRETGMPLAGITAATCISAAIGSFLMGGIANYPIALAPGMGLNAYFTYSVVKGMGVPWQTALGAVFISGVIFLALTALGVRRLILTAVPPELYASVAAGIGIFIAFIGLRNAGIIVSHPATSLALGHLGEKPVLLSLAGLLLTTVLFALRVPGSILIGVLATYCGGALAGIVHLEALTYGWNDITSTVGRLDVPAALHLGAIEIVFVFLFVDMFDNLGTLLAVAKRAGLLVDNREIPRINRILTADALASITGSLAGTSTVVSYVESAAGVVAGGRSGFTSIVVGLLFLLALPVAPLIGAIPAAATSPALVIVGSLMIAHTREIDWEDPLIGIPSFITVMMIPLTFSIANGLAFGFTAYTLIALFTGRARRVHWLLYVLTALFILRFIYLSQA